MEQEENKKIKRQRSAAYPAANLKEAIDGLKTLHKALGSGPYDRKSAAIQLGYSGVTGASASKIAALVHYGMLQRVAGGGYQETTLSGLLVNFVDEAEYSKALVDAFLSPTLFRQLYKDFSGKALPEKLDVILIRSYRITESVSKEAARTFRQSAEYCGLLKNGFLGLEQSTDVNQANNDGLVVGAMEQRATSQSQSEYIDPQQSSGTYMPYETLSIPISHGVSIVVPNSMASDVAKGMLAATIKDLEKTLDDKYKVMKQVERVDSEEDNFQS